MLKKKSFLVFLFCFVLANNEQLGGATGVLDVLHCFNQDVTLNMGAVWSVLFGKEFQKDVAVCISAGPRYMVPVPPHPRFPEVGEYTVTLVFVSE